MIGAAFGNDARDSFNKIWSAHNGFFVDYTTGVATKDKAKQDKAVQDLTTMYVPQFAALISGATGLPVDAVCAEKMEAGQETRVTPVGQVPAGWMILDIGPRSVELFAERVSGAGTVVWNGPAGVFEIPEFSEGTRRLGEAVASSGAYSLVGGGDTAAAVEQLGLAGRFSHVSTGGGATLEYMEGKELPGVAILKEAG